MNTEDRTS